MYSGEHDRETTALTSFSGENDRLYCVSAGENLTSEFRTNYSRRIKSSSALNQLHPIFRSFWGEVHDMRSFATDRKMAEAVDTDSQCR